MKTLLLASWYPNKLSALNGDFIKRHAEAISHYQDVYVIHVVRDADGVLTKEVLKEERVSGQLTEVILYYYSPLFKIDFLNKFFSDRKYQALYRNAVRDYIERIGRPNIVHVHVGFKAGTIALWIKRKFGIPYIVSEHWTGFLTESKEKFNDLSALKKRLWKRVMKKSEGFSAVSSYLKSSLAEIFNNPQGRVIPNVVNKEIFFPDGTRSSEKPVFVHISNLQPYKNPEMIIRAFKIVTTHYPEAQLDMIGATDEKLLAMVMQMGIGDKVTFQKEKSQQLLANDIRKATALILYSHYETFGCVIIEANACGTPVIVSDIPVFHETVIEKENGLFAKPNDPDDLAEKMLEIIRTRSSFDSKAIASMTGLKYSYETIGRKFSDWYTEVLQKI